MPLVIPEPPLSCPPLENFPMGALTSLAALCCAPPSDCSGACPAAAAAASGDPSADAADAAS
jgi:hypothetical protein